MLNLEIIRQRSRELLILAEQENDPKKLARLLECSRLLQEDDCLSNRRKREPLCSMLVTRLGFEPDEAYDFYEYLNHATEVWGELISTWSNGKEQAEGKPVKALLNPEMEDYYQFESGRIFKVYDGTRFYYLDGDGNWVYDGSLQKRFYDSGYSYWRIKYRIEKKDSLSDSNASADKNGIQPEYGTDHKGNAASHLDLCQLLRKIADSK